MAEVGRKGRKKNKEISLSKRKDWVHVSSNFLESLEPSFLLLFRKERKSEVNQSKK